MKNRYMQQIDDTIANGKFKDNWESLAAFRVPDWYPQAKFGIFIHWGLYSVPAFNNEWYSRNMYMKGSEEYEHHIATYGAHKDFGYKDFIPMFKAERFDAEEWAELFSQSGAKYVMPVAEHHDGFQMYKSELSRFNAFEMGPCRDLLAEMKTAFEYRGLEFCVSS
ncbi:MAG: alpha-L-fucosidase, partial [Bacilli bacterium]